MSNATDIFIEYAKSIDYHLLTGQKRTLAELSSNPLLKQREKDDIEGLLNFIDSFQDLLVDKLGMEQSDIFPYMGLNDEEESTEPQTITKDDWTVTLEGEELTIKKDGEERTYDIKEKNSGLDYKLGDDYFYIRTDEGFYYQFKFEEGDFFVGDKYRNDDEFIDSFASHVFGE